MMRDKMLGTGEKGYNIFRKIRVVISALKYAMSDFSVAYKVVFSSFLR